MCGVKGSRKLNMAAIDRKMTKKNNNSGMQDGSQFPIAFYSYFKKRGALSELL